MKLFILSFTFIASVNAFAGAYSLSCSNENGSVQVGNGSLTVEGKDFEYYGDESVRLMGLQIVDFLKVNAPKVVVSVPNVATDVAQGGVKVLKIKKIKDECGNQGTETKYSEAVGIYQTDGAPLVNVARLKCTERIISGHCR